MSYSLQFQQSQKQMQHLMVSQKMQQAMHFLQLPSQELSEVLLQEMEQNPLLERLENPEEVLFLPHQKKQAFVENTLFHEPSLFEFLMQQARETFAHPNELALAESLIGNFDERGFFTPHEELTPTHKSVLKTIQTFEPKGIGASSVQESLLIQMRGKEGTLAYLIVEKHFDDLLKNRIPLIEKGLRVSSSAILDVVEKEIAKLDLSPGASFSKHVVPYITPDVVIQLAGEVLVVVVDDDVLPPIGFNRQYLKLLEDPKASDEDKAFIREKVAAAKWLIRSVDQRNRTLNRLAQVLIEKQRKFFLSPEGKLTPLSMRELAEVLELHESTIARAVANKYLECPRGLYPLRYFFTQSYKTEEGEEISSRTVKDAIVALVEAEDKAKPHSDEKIATLLKEQGIPCARRTVAKYRTQLKLGTAKQRKRYN